MLVGKIDISPMVDEQLHNLLVRLAAIAEHNGFQQGCPAQIVDGSH
jgi:hypothetical protein